MDGDLAPVTELVELCDRYDALLLLDDAHGFGVLGENGAGMLSECGIRSERVLYMATLGKAAGVHGAFLAADAAVVDYLVNRARTYIYTTAAPPLLAYVLLESLRIIRSETGRRQHLRLLIDRFTARLGSACRKMLPSVTAIQPFVLGGALRALSVSNALLEHGLIVPAVRPPTVPRGTARLRISLSAGHSLEDVDRLASALCALAP